MSKPFDAATRKLLELDPAGWLACVGLPVTGPVRAVDSDLSTVTAEADTILQVGEPADYLAHIELQTSHDLTLPRRLLRYNVLLNYRHNRPVRSVAILLSREANSPTFTGRHRILLPEGSSYLDFRYSVVRVWTMDVETILRSSPGALPLAPLAKVGKKDLPDVIRRMKGRFEREVSQNESNLLWTATKILMGMRYSDDLVENLLRGVQGMKESVTYQAILREGRAEGVVEGLAKGRAEGIVQGEQNALLRIGRRWFGEPPSDIVARVEGIDDESRLTALLDRISDVSSWDELLALP